MRGTEFAELEAFVAIADRGSFVAAAAALDISTSTLSQTIRSLEERIGVRLFNRTTRSVALTEAGEDLLARVRPALDELSAGVAEISARRETPAGRLRLNVSSLAAGMVLAQVLHEFCAKYPAITLEITVDDGAVDIVRGHFDAGIRAGQRIERDMIAVRIGPETRAIAIASPSYIASYGCPRVPQDLHAHSCIRFRLANGTFHRWEFNHDGGTMEVTVGGPLVVNDMDLMVRGALDGIGIGYTLEAYVASFIDQQRLLPLLEEWAVPFSGWYIYYPSRRQLPGPLKAFIDFMRAKRRT